MTQDEKPGGEGYARLFGQHVRYLRENVYKETTREFADRLGLSAAYLNRIELAQVGEPRRETVLKLAERLGADPASLLVKAGYLPADGPRRGEYDHISIKLELMDDGVREIAITIIDALLANHPKEKHFV